MTTTIIALTIGRLILAWFFLENAYKHIFHLKDLAGWAASKGLRYPVFMTFVTGLMLAAGALSILTGVAVPYGVALLVIFLLGTLAKMHTFWKETDPNARMSSRIEFAKNLAIIGGLLMILAIPGPWPYSL